MWITTNWKILKEMGIPDHLIRLLRNLYVGQEATVRTGHETTDWFKTGKRVCQGCKLSPCLFILCAEYIIRNAGLMNHKLESRLLEEISATSDIQMIPLMAESEEELKSLLMKMKEEREKAGLKLNIQKTKIMASCSITSWQITGKEWKQWQILFSWAPKSLWMVTTAMKLKDTCSLEENLLHT